MSQNIKSNFNKRFEGRIRIVYAHKLPALERQVLNERLCKAIIEVLSGILGREPTQRELLGIDDLAKAIKHK